ADREARAVDRVRVDGLVEPELQPLVLGDLRQRTADGAATEIARGDAERRPVAAVHRRTTGTVAAGATRERGNRGAGEGTEHVRELEHWGWARGAPLKVLLSRARRP